MFSSLKIGQRLAISVTVMLLLFLTIILAVMLDQLSSVNKVSEKRQLIALQNSFEGRIENTSAASLMVIDSIVNADGVAQAFAARDRDRVAELTLPIFKSLKEKYNIQQFQFHTPPATSFLRLHKLEKYGDDLSGFRHTVVRANTERNPVYGLESGVAGIGLRGVVPVFYNSNHVGSAEIGLSFGQDFFDKFTLEYNAPSALLIEKNGSFEAFGSTIANPEKTTLTLAEFRKALEGGSVQKQVELNGISYAVMASPVTDFTNQTIGVSEILIDRTDFVKSYQKTLLNILLIGFFSLALGLLFTWYISRGITKPIEELTEAADSISRGEFEQEIVAVDRKDEVGTLARAVARMAASIQLAMEQLIK